ncbi:MAG: nucleotidyltransferase domain-containing protein [Spirochaetes bacterium]|nr:nucleotidyltransferase domain-containing protein [Spirochaetota bacterium]
MKNIKDNKTIINDLKSLLNFHFPELIENVILFGSQIDGKSREYSDYDILIVLREQYNWKLENEIIDVCYDIDLKYDIVTDIKVISKNELNEPRGKQTYIQSALTTGLYA